MAGSYVVHVDGKTPTIQLRVVRIKNGWLLKAGMSPVFCTDMAEVTEKVFEILKGFLGDVRASEMNGEVQ